MFGANSLVHKFRHRHERVFLLDTVIRQMIEPDATTMIALQSFCPRSTQQSKLCAKSPNIMSGCLIR